MILIGFNVESREPRRVEISVYDYAGLLVVRPLGEAELRPGPYTVWWNERRLDGEPAPRGMYLVEYRSDSDTTYRIVRRR